MIYILNAMYGEMHYSLLNASTGLGLLGISIAFGLSVVVFAYAIKGVMDAILILQLLLAYKKQEKSR